MSVGVEGDVPGRGDLAEALDEGLGEPDVSVGPRGDLEGVAQAGDRFRDLPVWRDSPDLAGCTLHEPEVAVRPRRDVAGERVRGGDGEVREGPRRQVEPPHLVPGSIREPDVPVGPGSDTAGCIEVGEHDLPDGSVGGDPGDATVRSFSEPDVAVRPSCNV